MIRIYPPIKSEKSNKLSFSDISAFFPDDLPTHGVSPSKFQTVLSNEE